MEGMKCVWTISLLVLLIHQSSALKRKLEAPRFNPDCDDEPACSPSNGNETYAENLIVTKSSSSEDNLYFIWSTIGSPSLLVLRTDLDAVVRVNWSQPEIPELTVEDGEVFSVSAYIFTGILQCNAKKDSSGGTVIPLELSECDDLVKIPMEGIRWRNASHTIAAIANDKSKTIGYEFVFRCNDGIQIENETLTGQLTISASIYNTDGREESGTSILPMLHTENSTQFEIALDNFPFSKKARYSLQHTYLSLSNVTAFKFKEKKGLNDQYTPGVFKYKQLNAPEELMFFGWKDGSYKSKELDLNNLVPIYYPDSMEDLPVLSSHDFQHKSLASEFVKQTFSDFVFVSFNMSFGSNDKDDGYDDFIAWNGQVGYGNMNYDGLTALIIGITVVGITLPVATMVIGGVMVFLVKKRRMQQYEVAKASIQSGGAHFGEFDNDNGNVHTFNYRPIET